MKNHIKIIICILIFCTSLCSCGNKSTTSYEMKNLGSNIIKITDDYIDGKIDYETAKRKINGTKDEIDNTYEKVEHTVSGLPVYMNDYEISLLSTYLSVALTDEHLGTGTYDELLEKRNEIAEIVGEKKRKK